MYVYVVAKVDLYEGSDSREIISVIDGEVELDAVKTCVVDHAKRTAAYEEPLEWQHQESSKLIAWAKAGRFIKYEILSFKVVTG